jgi:putative SOS response-associated peptidase YedK
MHADEVPDDNDEQIRQSYNFAPGYHGLIYRAATNDRGTNATPLDEHSEEQDRDGEPSPKKTKLSHPASSQEESNSKATKYKLQAAKWGLIPFWTKRSPDYGSMLRTINCRDDSLIENRGMWNTMKQRKRCIVVAEGFYEWLKKNNGKEKIPHFIKRKDGQLMCFAGLWDCVTYEDMKEGEKLYTYTIITTDSNKQLKFLHDRMPVILEPGSENMRIWLDPSNVGWNKELQGMLKPFQGELEIYPVDKAVGKVGNNSPSFVVPIDSKENKKNIANFFGTQKAKAGEIAAKNEAARKADAKEEYLKDSGEGEVEAPESNAPLPAKVSSKSEGGLSQAIKREADDLADEDFIQAEKKDIDKDIKRETDDLEDKDLLQAVDKQIDNNIKHEEDDLDDETMLEAEKSPPVKVWKSPSKSPTAVKKQLPSTQSSPVKSTASKTKSATSNSTQPKTPTKDQNKKITAFFGGKS